MATTFTEFITLESITCGRCGGTFALNRQFLGYAREHKGEYHCPYCNVRWNWNETEEDRLRKKLEERERELREAKCESLRLSHLHDEEKAARQNAEMKLGRVKNGVCPCCKRSFSNLRRHIASKHPNVNFQS